MKKAFFILVSLLLALSMNVQAGTFNTKVPTATTTYNVAKTESPQVKKQKTAPVKVQKSQIQKTNDTKTRKRWVAIVLCLFLGMLGVHRFYLGDTFPGLIQLFSAGGLGVWFIIDFFRLCFGGFKSRFNE